MPHQCTNCGRTFPDGSKEMLSGCPDCGGNKFQFNPGDRPADDPSPGRSEPPDRSGVANTVTQATRTVRDWVSGDDSGQPQQEHPVDSTSQEGSASSGTTRSQTGDASTRTADASTQSSNPAVTGPDESTGASDSAESHPDSPTPDDASETTEWPDHGFEDPYRDRPEPTESDPKEWPDVGQRPEQEEPSEGSTPPADPASEADAASIDTSEDTAQASARSDVVSPDELPEGPPTRPTDEGNSHRDSPSAGGQTRPDASGGRIASTPDDDDSPDLKHCAPNSTTSSRASRSFVPASTNST
ncbi:Zn-ribbon containing protein [Natronoarchaeum sp. GCM10025703]|uniref:OapC/ArvC family zinc-ribbon domain-containing protein n=1 Tax=Natronoarchaeum sp. GCM10025703 TaxID=3252685 RepID=UPI003621D0B4